MNWTWEPDRKHPSFAASYTRVTERIKAKLLPLVASFAWLPLLAFLLFATSGSFLVVSRPEKADLFVVLAGGTENRPLCGARAFARELCGQDDDKRARGRQDLR